MLIGRPNAEIPYVDSAMGHNNPIKAVLAEAETACDHSGNIESQNIEYIISIRTGMPQNVSLKAPNIIERALVPINTVRAVVRMITDANDVAEKMEKHFSMMPGVYFRLNVDQGLQGITLEQWQRLGEALEHTKRYIANVKVSKSISDIARQLSGKTDSTSTQIIKQTCMQPSTDSRPCCFRLSLLTLH
jgi:hypothetical protein